MKVEKPQDDKYIYTDGVDYSKTSDDSVWGTEEEITSKLINKSVASGSWLNLCAGDGRFNNRLLEKASEVVAADFDENALQKLSRIAPENLRGKLRTKKINVVERFPFDDNKFDGIFCVGTLHLFPKKIFKEKVFSEMDRVLKTGGQMIIDFAVDIKREHPDGSLRIVENEPNYSLEDAKILLKEIFAKYKIEMFVDKSEPEKVTLNERSYTFSCNFILLKAVKV